MAKYPVIFQKGNVTLKRSVDLDRMELLFILSVSCIVRKTKRASGEITFAFPAGEFNTVATVKRVPLWVMKRFKPEKDWR